MNSNPLISQMMDVSSKTPCHCLFIQHLLFYCFIDCAVYAPYGPFWAFYHLLYLMPSSIYSIVLIHYYFTLFLNHFLKSSSSLCFLPIKHGTGWFHRFRQRGRTNQWNPLARWLIGTKPCNLQSLDGTRMRSTTAPHQRLHKTILVHTVGHAVCSIFPE